MYLLAPKIRWNIGDKGKSGPSAQKKMLISAGVRFFILNEKYPPNPPPLKYFNNENLVVLLNI